MLLEYFHTKLFSNALKGNNIKIINVQEYFTVQSPLDFV